MVCARYFGNRKSRDDPTILASPARCRLQREGLRDGAWADRTIPSAPTPIRRSAHTGSSGECTVQPRPPASSRRALSQGNCADRGRPEKGKSRSPHLDELLMLERYESAGIGRTRVHEIPTTALSHLLVIWRWSNSTGWDEAQRRPRRLNDALSRPTRSPAETDQPWLDRCSPSVRRALCISAAGVIVAGCKDTSPARHVRPGTSLSRVASGGVISLLAWFRGLSA